MLFLPLFKMRLKGEMLFEVCILRQLYLYLNLTKVSYMGFQLKANFSPHFDIGDGDRRRFRALSSHYPDARRVTRFLMRKLNDWRSRFRPCGPCHGGLQVVFTLKNYCFAGGIEGCQKRIVKRVTHCFPMRKKV